MKMALFEGVSDPEISGAKLISSVKFCTIDFFTGFAPLPQAQIAPSLRKCQHGAKTTVFDTW
jgi:hypothetical protein